MKAKNVIFQLSILPKRNNKSNIGVYNFPWNKAYIPILIPLGDHMPNLGYISESLMSI